MTAKCARCGGSGLEPDYERIGKEMRELRERAGISLADLSSRLKVSAPYLSEQERGTRHFSPAQVAQFKEALKK